MQLRLSQQDRALLAVVTYERRLLAVVGLILFGIVTDVFQVIGGPDYPAGRIKILFFPLLVLFVVLHLRHILRALFAVPELAALIILVIASIGWSIDPSASAEDIFRFLMTTGTVMTIASMVSFRRFLLSAATFAGIATLASIVAVVLFPSARGIDPWPDTWRGVFSHKNALGTFSTYALILTVAGAAISEGAMRRAMIIFAGASAVMLVASDSRTSQIIAILSLSSLSIPLMRPDFTRVWATGYVIFIGFLAGFVALAFATGLAEMFFEIIDRRPTLSGRIPLWELVWPSVTERIWSGYGYYAFWQEDSRAVMEIARDTAIGYIPYYSHNGLLEILLHVGILGPILLVLAVIRGIVGAFAMCQAREARTMAAVGIILPITFLLFNITEGSFIGRESAAWILIVGMLVRIGLADRARRARPGARLRFVQRARRGPALASAR
jgi:O-antigen ligase